MASTSPSQERPCVTCNKGNNGIFKCEGCTQEFCTIHATGHRKVLYQQLEEILVEHDTLQDIIIANRDQIYPLMNFIDEWERKSIKKIQQMAKETRQKLAELADVHRSTVAEELNLLSKPMKKAYENDEFFETNLIEWLSSLNILKHELTNIPLSSNVNEDQSEPLIYPIKFETASSEYNEKIMFKYHQTKSKMRDSQEIFEQCEGDAIIEDNGRLIIHQNSNDPVEVRGKVEYSSGIHRFRLRIEKNPPESSIFFGIISQSTSMDKTSYESSSTYGWADNNKVFLAGVCQTNHPAARFSDIRQGDIILLVFDCTNKKIYHTNGLNRESHQLDIDIDKCPFPWQLHINLFGNDVQVRLISAISTP